MAMARLRSFGSSNSPVASASADGMTAAPATPSAARLASSISALDEYAADSEASAKSAPPTSSSFLRPYRSPRVPMVTRKPAITKP